MNIFQQEQKKLNLDDIEVLLLVNGMSVIAVVENVDVVNDAVFVVAPVALRTIYEEETGEISGFVTEPFMAPFIDFSISEQIPINRNLIVSTAKPNKYLLEKYTEIVENHTTFETDESKPIPETSIEEEDFD